MDYAKLGNEILDYVVGVMAIDEKWMVREENGFMWWAHRLPQRIWFEQVQDAYDPPPIRICGETAIFQNAPDTSKTAAQLDLLNRFPSLNAWVWDRQTGYISYRCSAYVSEETAAWLKQLISAAVALQIAEAHLKGTEEEAESFSCEVVDAKNPVNGERRDKDGMLSVIEQMFEPMGRKPSPFTEPELRSALDINPPPWVLATGDGTALTAEFRFTGNKSAVTQALIEHSPVNRETTLLQVSGEESHPWLGNGALLRLTLPIKLDLVDSIKLAQELNLAETKEFTWSYQFGAWRSDPKFQSVSFYFLAGSSSQTRTSESVSV